MMIYTCRLINSNDQIHRFSCRPSLKRLFWAWTLEGSKLKSQLQKRNRLSRILGGLRASRLLFFYHFRWGGTSCMFGSKLVGNMFIHTLRFKNFSQLEVWLKLKGAFSHEYDCIVAARLSYLALAHCFWYLDPGSLEKNPNGVKFFMTCWKFNWSSCLNALIFVRYIIIFSFSFLCFLCNSYPLILWIIN